MYLKYIYYLYILIEKKCIEKWMPIYMYEMYVLRDYYQITIKYKGATIWNNISSKFNTNGAINKFKSF